MLFLAVALAAQFQTGPIASSNGCEDIVTGDETEIVAADVGVFFDGAHEEPKQGEVFTAFINVLAFPQPCGTHLVVRPGFKLPPGVELATGQGVPAPRCFAGPAGGNLSPVGCPTAPTATSPDGTLIFDAPNGLWNLADETQLQIDITLVGVPAESTTLQGHVEFTSFDFPRQPLAPQVAMQVFLNPPVISAPSPAVVDITASDAHVFGFVDPHFNAGAVTLSLAPSGLPLEVVDSGSLTASQFQADVDSVVTGLLADTAYDARWSFTLASTGATFDGGVFSFRTLPPPTFAFTKEVDGGGDVLANPAPNADGTYAEGTVVMFTLSPDAGQQATSFTVNGTAVAGASTSITIAGAVDVRASFQPVAADSTGGADGGSAGSSGSTGGAPSTVGTNPSSSGGSSSSTAGSSSSSGSSSSNTAAGAGVHFSDGDGRGTGSATESERDAEAGGCASTKPCAIPFALLAVLVARRRRRR